MNARTFHVAFLFVAILLSSCGVRHRAPSAAQSPNMNEPVGTVVMPSKLAAAVTRLSKLGYHETAMQSGAGTFFGIVRSSRRQISVTLQKRGSAIGVLYAAGTHSRDFRAIRSASVAWAEQREFADPVFDGSRWYMNHLRVYPRLQRDFVGWA